MVQEPFGQLLSGSLEDLRRAYDRMQLQPVDWDLMQGAAPDGHRLQRTIGRSVSVSGPGTFLGKATRTLTFEPSEIEGWWFVRDDLPDCLPVRVSIRNVWTTGDTVSNIVLRSGPPQNYIRMVEHIVALKVGLPIDNLMIRLESGDPPLFKRGSLDLVEAIEHAGMVETTKPVQYWTVKERVTVSSGQGNFLIFEPTVDSAPRLTVDCAVDFPTAIGQQRIKFPLTYEHFRRGAEARTNTPFGKMLYVKTIGRIFADLRHLGYTKDNILIAGRHRYINEPKLLHDGKSLEAVWHRAILDLLAAVALLEEGRFAGHITSYRAGHGLDCLAMRLLYKKGLLRPL